MALDYKVFERDIGNETHPLAVVLKGHLWLEACMNRALEVALHDPGMVNLERESFSRKLSWCAALNAVPPDSVKVFAAVNKLRNELAHQLGKEITEEDVLKVEQSIQGHLRVMWDEWNLGKSFDSTSRRLARVFEFMLATVEFATMRRDWHKRYQEQIEAHELMRELWRRTHGETIADKETAAMRPPAPPEPNEIWVSD